MRNFVEYYKLLERDRQALQSFLDFITINVSEFFRNPDKFEELKTNIYPGCLPGRTGEDMECRMCTWGRTILRCHNHGRAGKLKAL